ncbi:arf-GAP with Rho-GAP domain, ANK repeat and PH domain-containing protein 1 isoform X2 [Corythoichthys intestinalis]|uniref:arf-GAP with Rho-GAP domain, ANK repeat and PH domain-containing protein 1 isoform X2 n=1 Tax=Corythoichthys intestinalis TaxID=161448 RepID=UPI0025A538F2|nr:arf-GAP with Rho-GAP domain, ANK repeat and PH domain-containing protein 1 isoform X2 [Corythoichthys intestinalis]
MTTPPPVPKPRARYARDSRGSTFLPNGKDQTALNGVPLITDEDASSHADIPYMVTPVDNSTYSPHPSSPPSIHSMVSNIASHVTSLAGAATSITNPALTPSSSDKPPVNFDAIVNSLSNIPSLRDAVVVDSTVPIEGRAEPAGPEAEEEDLYITVVESWDDDADSDSSNEGDVYQNWPASPTANGPMRGDQIDNLPNNIARSPSLAPPRPVLPLPLPVSQSAKSRKPSTQKTPRVATIRVSRKKGKRPDIGPESAVVRASWLDVWKGFRHNVYWATLDGQLMFLWKKRTDQFSEILFHVSSITNVKKLDKGRFSIYFKKKHYDFMAHSDDVQDGWVQSLLATRGQPSPDAPDIHGSITVKDPKSRFYAAIWGHDFWIYQNKDSYQLGVACYSIPLNLATVRTTGKHSLTLTTPFKTFNLSVDSSKDLSIWLEGLSSSISSALSCSQVATRLWKNPSNRQCADCGTTDPEWASVNLLLVICHSCAGQHRALGSTRSKVRSLKMDNKVWTEPLIQLFVAHGNRLANQVWAPLVPTAEQIGPDSSDESRSKFIQDKYSKGRYRRVHALASSAELMQQRLREVVCGGDVEETLSLICSGSKVCQTDPQSPSVIQLAERAGQAMQAELLRLNEYTEMPPYLPKSVYQRTNSAPSGEEDEELHGKLEDDRFLFSLENNSAACDVLDLREVLSLFRKDKTTFQFELITLDNRLICGAESEDELLIHLVHILKVILPSGVSYAEVCGAVGVSKVCVLEDSGASDNSEAWLLLWDDGVSVHRARRGSKQALKMELGTLSHHEMLPSEDILTMVLGQRRVSLHFDEHESCGRWYSLLQDALANRNTPESTVVPNQTLYPLDELKEMDLVPLAVQRCIQHINEHGLRVEGVYRRCGLASKVSRLVEALVRAPVSAPLESDEQGVLDAAAALKQYIRQQEMQLFSESERKNWMRAAVISDERARFSAYRHVLQQLPSDKRATLNALFGHFYMVQTFSQVNKMSPHNLALVLVPSLFYNLNADLLKMTRELILHHALLFLVNPEEEITVL